MNHILHMSDFHFGKDMTIEKSRLDKLAIWIKNSNISISYLIFTGDMIDAPMIQADCIRKLKRTNAEKYKFLKATSSSDELLSLICSAGDEAISSYNSLLRETTISRMTEAANIFNDFLKKINLDNKRVILCCGNHDRMRFAGDVQLKCDKDNCIDESILLPSFEAYNILCKIVNPELSYKTMTYSYDNMNFVIGNSNWKIPSQNQTNNMCVNCKSLSNELAQLREAKSFNRNLNLFIAHKPYDDFCESTKYPYKGELLTVSQMVERTVEAFLYGDKHSYSVRVGNKLKEFMCGMPLRNCGVRYNLLTFDPMKGIQSCSYILYDGNGWIMVPITDCMESIYNISQKYLKGYTFTLLTNSNTIPNDWDVTIKLIQSSYEKNSLAEMSKLFSAFSELRQGKQSIELDETNMFSQLVSLIESSEMQALSIKGPGGIGKSTFMTVTYLYMLWLFSGGKTRYIPVYFNMETIISLISKDNKYAQNIDAYISYCVEHFLNFFKRCCTVRDEHSLPICIFIDGLEKSKSLAPGNDTVEKRIYQIVETELKANDRYVMSFNTQDSYHFDDTFEKIKDFTYVLFMNNVRIVSYKSKEYKQDMFLSSYLTLRNRPIDIEALQSLKNALIKFRKPSIDLYFLRHCDDLISKIENDELIWNVLRGYLTELVKITDKKFKFRLDVVQPAVGLLFSQRKRYSEIVSLEETKTLTIKEFLEITHSPVLANYLIANYYVETLKKYSDTTTRIPKDSILFSFMPHELSILVRLILDEKEDVANDILTRFIDSHVNEMDNYLYSMIVYLCGHLRTDENMSLLKKIPKPVRKADDFFTLCKRRSYDLASAVCSIDNFPVEDIVLQLIGNEDYRKFNRSYQLHYYQDASINAIKNQSAWVLERRPQIGFDFRYSFLMLLSKLEPALRNARTYPLMELDLFTLCDLIYSRLQYYMPDGLFYSAKYNEKNDSECEAILLKVTFLLKKYNDLYKGKRSVGDPIGAYFDFMNTRLTSILKEVIANKGKNVNFTYVSYGYDYAQILKLSSLPRVGWSINVSGEIKVDEQDSYTSINKPRDSSMPMKESIMQHIVETLYIAQMFLPEKLSEEEYQKSNVISLLLLSELGKIGVGDYSPLYSNQHTWQKSEEKSLAHILTLGALDGYAKQPAFFRPISFKTTTDINMKICWEIKMIQMEYKYYALYNQLGFDSKRRAEFEEEFSEPTTRICKTIREQLILSNPDFKKYFK